VTGRSPAGGTIVCAVALAAAPDRPPSKTASARMPTLATGRTMSGKSHRSPSRDGRPSTPIGRSNT
jgi:hypothetical protein